MTKRGTMSDKDKKKVSKILRDFDEAASARATYETRWERYYKMYRVFENEVASDGRSSIKIPYIFSQIEAVVPKVAVNLFAARPFIGILPRHEESVERAKAMETLLDYQVGQRMRLPVTGADIIKESYVYGTAVSKITWRFESAIKKQWVPIEDELGTVIGREPQEVEQIVYDDPHLEHIDLYDFYLDPTSKTIARARYAIHRVLRSPEYVEKLMDAGIYRKFDMSLLKGGMEGEDFRQSRLSDAGIGGSNNEGTDNRIELLEHWTDGRLTVVANRKLLLRDEENPYWHGKKPFVAFKAIPVMHEFYGIGFPEMMEHLEAELNTLRNQRRDNVSLVLNRMWKKLKMAEIDPNQLISRAGGVIEVDSMDDLAALETPDVTSSAYTEEKSIRQDIDMVTGIHDHARGSETSRKETATQATILSNAANERFKLSIMLASEALMEVAQFIIDLNQQHLDSTRVVRIVGIEGASFVEVSPEDVVGQFDLYPAGSATEPQASRDIRQAQFIQLYQSLANNPLIDQQKLLKTLLDVFGVKDANSFFVPQQPQMAQMGQTGGDAMANMMGGMQGGAIDPSGGSPITQG